ncbi:MAG: aldehyde dehydrogenase family protein [Nocardioidaceae bacterium]
MNSLSVLNPATGRTLEELALASTDDVSAAVEASRRAYSAWSRTAPAERAQVLRSIADSILLHQDELALLETRNVGKPLADSKGEVEMAAQVFHFYAGAVDKHYGDTIPVAGGLDMTLNSPLGVIGVIVPWNFPLVIATWNIGPALACGNTVVLKPAEITPLTAVRLAEIAIEAGLPPDVLRVVAGTGEEAGHRLVTHPDVAKIAFTGSTEVGKGIMREAASTMKRLMLELGGKASNIVFADADLELAAREAVPAIFGNSGQDCCSRGRILVEKPAFDRFVELFVAAAAELRVGDPEDATYGMGPLVSAAHRARVATFLDEPADVAFSGDVPRGDGFWFAPTVITCPAPDSRLVTEEIFGPIATVAPFSGEREAVEMTNASPYGLSGSVWSRDGAKALRVARDLEAGTLSVNSNSSVRVSTPFGGFKQSGFGRELGMEAMNSYSELKNVYVRLDET